jgi:Arc/MetJ-type ribon-helix-helix transcriptional regulator
MPTDQTRNVLLIAEPNVLVRAQVVSGHCQNVSDGVRAGLRLPVRQAQGGGTRRRPRKVQSVRRR